MATNEAGLDATTTVTLIASVFPFELLKENQRCESLGREIFHRQKLR
jgi:hypothetical protein